MAIKKEIIDDLLKGRDPKTVFSSDGLLGELKKVLADRILNAEMDEHLSESKQDEVSEDQKPGNHRNGYSKKTVLTENSAIEVSIPRDRHGTFEPQLIAKYQRRFPGFDEKIVSMYARGMSVRDIQGHLRDLYGIEVSPQLISSVTDAVLEEVGRWQNRPLDPLYALVFFDALRVLNRGESTNSLKRGIYTGRVSSYQAKHEDEMQAVADALSLIANIVMAWNTAQMQQVVDHWNQRPRRKVPVELIGDLAPTRTEGINLRGVFNFPFEEYAEQLMPSSMGKNAAGSGG